MNQVRGTIGLLSVTWLLIGAAVEAAGPVEFHAMCRQLPHTHLGPFVNLDDDRVLGVSPSEAMISDDEGKTWKHYPLFSDPERFQTRNERALLKTRDGTIVLAFLNEKERHPGVWDDNDRKALAEFYLPVYVTRSTDNGKTWTTPQKIQDGWCGAMRCMIQLKSGRLVLTSQQLVFDPGRHNVMSYVSDDDGKTWQRSNLIDLGGRGSHGGAMEPTVVQLRDGRVYMLIRTPQRWFWEAFSKDGGLTWTDIRQSKIKAPTSPPQLCRLQSGRLVLVCNLHRNKSLGYRDELSLIYSEDDGRSWSDEMVLARDRTPDGGDQYRHMLAYPYILERQPGILWVTTMYGKVRVSIEEADFTKKN